MPKRIDKQLTEDVKNHLRAGVPPYDISRMSEFAGRISLSKIYGLSNSLVSIDLKAKAENDFFKHSEEIQEAIVHEYLRRKKPPVIEFSTENKVKMKYYHFSARRTKIIKDCDKEEEKEENDGDNDDTEDKDDENDNEDGEVEIDPPPSLTLLSPSVQVSTSSSSLVPSLNTTPDPNLTSLLQYEKAAFRKAFNYVGFTSLLTNIGGCVENGVILCVRLMYRKFKESFMKALVTLELGFRSLSLEDTLAMKSSANLSNNQLRIIRKYLHEKCERKILASDRKVRSALQEPDNEPDNGFQQIVQNHDQTNSASVGSSKKRKFQQV